MANVIEDYYINKLTNKVNDLMFKVESAMLYLTNTDGYIKYTTPGTYTFRIPYGLESIYISGIGGGGAGGTGGDTREPPFIGAKNYAAGGGGGGMGTAVKDQQIEVTPGEILTITVGEGGAIDPLMGAQPGGDTIISRGSTPILVIDKGTAGANGGNGGGTSVAIGGVGGTIGGSAGGNATSSSAGAGGNGAKTNSTASTYYFAGYGSGGDGGNGATYVTNQYTPGDPGTAGADGAFILCFKPGVRFADVTW